MPLPANISEKSLKDGKDIYLTNDKSIQEIVEEKLQRLIKEIPCKGAYLDGGAVFPLKVFLAHQ